MPFPLAIRLLKLWTPKTGIAQESKAERREGLQPVPFRGRHASSWKRLRTVWLLRQTTLQGRLELHGGEGGDTDLTRTA